MTPHRAKSRPGKRRGPIGLVLTDHLRDRSGLAIDKVPLEPEYRGPGLVTPAPDLTGEVERMFREDQEAIDWRHAEERAEWFGRGRR